MEQNKFVLAAVTALLANNDMHYMHLLSKGKDFDKSHNLAQDYYDKLAEDVDYLMELTLEVGYTVPNYSKALDVIPDYPCENLPEYDYATVIEHIKAIIGRYINALRDLRNGTNKDDIQSRLDDMIRDWEKELNYRLTRRQESPVQGGFINTGLDERVSHFVGL